MQIDVRRRLAAALSPRPLRAVAALLGLLLIATGLLQLHAAQDGIEITRARVGATPVTLFRAASIGGPKPVVVISHGFAGSQQLMRSYALNLARAGYLAVSFDYFGHGRHPEALRGDITKIEGATQMLVAQTRAVVDFALSQGDAGQGLAILGHSMASDIIVRYAATDPRVRATVAVSMFSEAVTAREPRNLLVIVGGLEGFLKDEALRVQGMVSDRPREATTVGNFEDGSARRIAFADGVEHVGVLYSSEALMEARSWLDAVFGRTAGSRETPASRGLAVVALLLGLVFLTWPLSTLLPKIASPALGASLTRWRLGLAALSPALITPLLLMSFPADFMGVLVGGYLAVHFLVYGLVSALALWMLGAFRPGRASGDRDHTAGELDRLPGAREAGPWSGSWQRSRRYPRLALSIALATVYLAGVFAWVLDSFVTSYAITATRLSLVLATFLGTLVYFLTDEWMAHGERTLRGAHLFTRVCFLLSLGIAVALSFEDLFFLVIIAAVIVIYFLVYGLFSRWIYRATGHPAVGAVANAVSFAWALGAVFPLISG